MSTELYYRYYINYLYIILIWTKYQGKVGSPNLKQGELT